MARQRTMTRRGRRTGGRNASPRRTVSGRGRSMNLRRGGRTRASNLRRGTRRGTRSRTVRGRARPRSRSFRGRRSRSLPPRGADGRFMKRRIRRTASRPAVRRRRVNARPRRRRRVRAPGASIVREASERSRAGPALVKRRWYRIDGPVDPSLPEGYAYPR